MSWMMKDEASAKAAEQEKAAAEQRKKEQGKAFKWWLNKGEEGKLVFVDGNLNKNGILTPPRFFQHSYIFLLGQRLDVVCPKLTAPHLKDTCPLCEVKDRASLVSLFTVVDQRPYTNKETGKVIPFTRKLFAAKQTTFEQLNKIAVLQGGLAGAEFMVSRVAEKAAAVGDNFYPLGKKNAQEWSEKFTVSFKTKEGDQKTVNLFQPLDYDKEIVYRTGDELRKMGFGNPDSNTNPTMPTTGTEGSGSDGGDYSGQL